ncbi:hypothetical protein HRW14_30300 [Streptomyces lunaelactis]|uniref:hypothetical protein n=1 Tax=Streptomyces lunaelactis TaxID=1535768 RepID=UPI0015852AA5|nr:hypothetical protein [Streptomyces lunaelactis]NUK54481.1 hypothetical protein [Streptomyces lunaelactis]NUK68436.1 hypothetical protein [Streptomyces lunaelactis]
MSVGTLPVCAIRLFDERRTSLLLAQRLHEDWVDDVLSVILDPSGAQHIGIDPATMFETVTAADLRESLLTVSRRGAEDLMKLLAAGSFYSGPDTSLQAPDEVRDSCVRDILRTVGEEAEFFTNHGHAEDETEANFLASAFHFNSLAVTLYDICLIAVSPDYLFVAWRFEDA